MLLTGWRQRLSILPTTVMTDVLLGVTGISEENAQP